MILHKTNSGLNGSIDLYSKWHSDRVIIVPGTGARVATNWSFHVHWAEGSAGLAYDEHTLFLADFVDNRGDPFLVIEVMREMNPEDAAKMCYKVFATRSPQVDLAIVHMPNPPRLPPPPAAAQTREQAVGLLRLLVGTWDWDYVHDSQLGFAASRGRMVVTSPPDRFVFHWKGRSSRRVVRNSTNIQNQLDLNLVWDGAKTEEGDRLLLSIWLYRGVPLVRLDFGTSTSDRVHRAYSMHNSIKFPAEAAIPGLVNFVSDLCNGASAQKTHKICIEIL